MYCVHTICNKSTGYYTICLICSSCIHTLHFHLKMLIKNYAMYIYVPSVLINIPLNKTHAYVCIYKTDITYIHKYIHTCYINTYIYTYIHMWVCTICIYICCICTYVDICTYPGGVHGNTYVCTSDTVKPETLVSGNFGKFGELGSNRQTLTFQTSKISAFLLNNAKQNKHLCHHFAKTP